MSRDHSLKWHLQSKIRAISKYCSSQVLLALLHSERPKLYAILAFLSAIGLMAFWKQNPKVILVELSTVLHSCCSNSHNISLQKAQWKGSMAAPPGTESVLREPKKALIREEAC